MSVRSLIRATEQTDVRLKFDCIYCLFRLWIDDIPSNKAVSIAYQYNGSKISSKTRDVSYAAQKTGALEKVIALLENPAEIDMTSISIIQPQASWAALYTTWYELPPSLHTQLYFFGPKTVGK